MLGAITLGTPKPIASLEVKSQRSTARSGPPISAISLPRPISATSSAQLRPIQSRRSCRAADFSSEKTATETAARRNATALSGFIATSPGTIR